MVRPFFIGVTRFSLFIPGSASWNISKSVSSEAAYKQLLFRPERLDARLDIFLNISLPQLAAAARNHNVRHVVQYSSHLPPKYQDALRDAAEQYDFLTVFCNDSRDQHSNIIDETAANMASETDENSIAYAWYRLDDDDILATSYFDQVAEYVTAENAGRVVSLGLGYSAIYHGGVLWDLREDYRPKSSIGQLYICSLDKSTKKVVQPPRQNHAIIDRWAPTILDSRTPSFITVLHPDQDGHLRGDGDDAIAALDSEQARRPYLVDLVNAGVGFETVAKSRFGTKIAILDSRSNSSALPLDLSTQPSHFDINHRGSVSIDIEVETSAAQIDARCLVALKYMTGERPSPSGRWQELDAQTLVTGFPLGRKLSADRMQRIQPQQESYVESVSIWTSKNFKGKAHLRYLRVVHD